MYTILILVVAFFLAFFWMLQLVTLMRLPDSAFPGRYDKPLWVAILVLTFFLGALAFYFWKSLARAEKQVQMTSDEIQGIIKKARKPDDSK